MTQQSGPEKIFSMPGVRVDVVILNWNGKSFLQRFLPLVKKHSTSWARLVVADNASTDGSLAWLKENHPEVHIIPFDQNLGYAGGYNRALQGLDADYFVLLNSDMEVTSGWIEPIIKRMQANPQVAACQPKIRSWADRELFEHAGAAGGFLDRFGYPFCRGRIFHAIEADHGQYDDAREVFWASGACLFVRAKAFHEAGGFDARFFAHMEEIDLCWRLHQLGYAVMVCPESVVYHVGGGSLPASNPRKTFLNFRNSLWMMAKNMPARHFYPAMMVRLALDLVAAFRFLLAGGLRDAAAVMRAQAALLGHVPRLRRQHRSLPHTLPRLMYRRSIVAMYFLGGKKRFSDLPGF